MKTVISSSLRKCLMRSLVGFAAVTSLTAVAQTPVTVIEYYNKSIASYFITARADEIALLDANPNLFTRTGKTFGTFAANAAPAGYAPVCRYQFLVPPSQFSSHFYGLPGDCTYIADTIRQLNLTNFIYEGLDFATLSPSANGTCPANAPIPIYRSFRKLSPVDVSNHRYSVNASEYAEMTRRGWAPENVVFCATNATPEPPRPVLANSDSLKNSCAAPRVGTSPVTGNVYPDRQGTTVDEKSFLRSFTDETYLWYREVNATPPSGAETVAAYFSTLKTTASTNSFTPTGARREKDEFHFTDLTADVEATNAGISYSYGIEWQLLRTANSVIAAAIIVDAGSPAEAAGVQRGDIITSVNGQAAGDLNVAANRERVIAAMFPSGLGQSNSFGFRRAGTSVTSIVTLTSSQLPIKTTPAVKVLNTPTGKVGYIAFYTFNTFAAEADLFNAFKTLQNEGVSDLVLDLRYNLGGFTYISSQLAYMVAGPLRTNNKAYYLQTRNDKRTDSAVPFFNITSDFVPSFPANQPLPTLNLGRVYVLTSINSASASEFVINGLRGIDVEVNLIGGATRGKPYGFLGENNCGTTYYTVQFKGTNNKGESDFITGFSPTCPALDDLRFALGDPSEEMLGVALDYRAKGTCRAITSNTLKSATSTPETMDSSNFFPRRYRAMNLSIDGERTLKENMR
jgi:carboxyl-terminal processing protease